MTNRFEIICNLTRDRAEAESAEAALLAARTLVDDAVSSGQPRKEARESIYVTENGTYAGILTAFARIGQSAGVRA